MYEFFLSFKAKNTVNTDYVSYFFCKDWIYFDEIEGYGSRKKYGIFTLYC